MKDIKRITKKSATKKSSSMSVISKKTTSTRVDQHGKTRFLEMGRMVNSDC